MLKPSQIEYFQSHSQSAFISSSLPVSDILFVIVIYNVVIENAPTFQSLEQSLKTHYPKCLIDVMICDNSIGSQIVIPNNNMNIYYLHDKSNPGVSASYNRAAQLALNKSKKWLLILDQDTDLPLDALVKYTDALKKWPNYPLYAPQVLSNNKFLSPCKYLLYRGTHLHDVVPGVQKMEYRNVLNSGLLICLKAFMEVDGYDEEVWLYFSDFTFFNKLKKIYKSYVVLDCRLEHSISSSDYSDLNFALNRFRYYCEGAKVASKLENSLLALISYNLTVGLRSLKMCKRFRNLDFLKTYFNTFY